MGLYEAAKDALTVAQKADNIELVQKLLEVQKMALDMQEKQQESNGKIVELQAQIAQLGEVKKMRYTPEGALEDPDMAGARLMFCPVCCNRDNFMNPLNPNTGYSLFCQTCGWHS